jgi:hypothetical protein
MRCHADDRMLQHAGGKRRPVKRPALNEKSIAGA